MRAAQAAELLLSQVEREGRAAREERPRNDEQRHVLHTGAQVHRVGDGRERDADEERRYHPREAGERARLTSHQERAQPGAEHPDDGGGSAEHHLPRADTPDAAGEPEVALREGQEGRHGADAHHPSRERAEEPLHPLLVADERV